MRKYLQFSFLFLQTFVKKHKKFILASALFGFFLTLLLIQSLPIIYESQIDEQRIGIIGRFNESNLPLDIQRLISSGLTKIAKDGTPEPSLALSWTVDEKGLEWTFHIRSDIFWHDGKKFKASDINYKFAGATFTPISDDIIKITLKEKFSPLPVIVSQPIFRENLLGVGIYKVVELIRSEDSISRLMIKPQVKSYTIKKYKFYSALSEAQLAFKLGEIDFLENINSYEGMERWNNIMITPITQYDKYVGIFFNLRNSLFKEKEVRQALSYAILRDFEEEKALTPISPLSWAYSQKIRLYNFDPETATKILSKSPLSSSSSSITISTFAALLNIAQRIADSWNKIGLNTKVKVESTIPSEYDVLLVTQAIPLDPDQYQYWQSTQEGTNLTHYNNQKIDKLLEDGRKTFDLETRKKIYADFQRYLVDDSPVIFLYYPYVYNISRK